MTGLADITTIIFAPLSVGAAYGLLTLVFIAGFLGFQKVTAIDAWVPLFPFSVLFTLHGLRGVPNESHQKRYDQTSTREHWPVAHPPRLGSLPALR